jgi:hypothetical protein
MGAAAEKLRAFCDALPELTPENVGLLLMANPVAIAGPPSEARAKLEALSAALSLPLPAIARLVAKVGGCLHVVRGYGFVFRLF